MIKIITKKNDNNRNSDNSRHDFDLNKNERVLFINKHP